MRPLNIVLVVVDSLRAKSLRAFGASDAPPTPFFDRLATTTSCFRRAYATECWTLPTHLSMFTGLLPNEHGAHFQSMAYYRQDPTIAELLTQEGYSTEIITRNPIFDGTLPGVTRGFQRRVRPLSPVGTGLNPGAVMFALSKPRLRRQMRSSGFFHPRQVENLRFVADFARITMPADREALAYAHTRMREYRTNRNPYFLVLNLFDVHAPYPPRDTSIFRSWHSLSDIVENVVTPFILPALGSHQYLRRGFHLAPRHRDLLKERYHDAIRLMDRKLDEFVTALDDDGILNDTVLIVTSDHGEAFGEHDLYLHDASVFQTHLHVPLFIHHPGRPAGEVNDVVSTRELFALMHAVGTGSSLTSTILDASYRCAHRFAFAQHIHYPHVPDAKPAYRQNLAAVLCDDNKVVVRAGDVVTHDLRLDPGESHPRDIGVTDIPAALGCSHGRPELAPLFDVHRGTLQRPLPG